MVVVVEEEQEGGVHVCKGVLKRRSNFKYSAGEYEGHETG